MPSIESNEPSVSNQVLQSILLGSIIALILVQKAKGFRLRLTTATVPGRRAQSLRRIITSRGREGRFKSLSPLHAIIQALEVPELL